jgi:hypothetical protein
MASNFGGDLYDFGNMTDEEVREIVVEHLRGQSNLDVDDIDVTVRNGAVILVGRVGTDAEVQVAEAILDDVLGIETYSNELVVDELRRGDAPLAADEEVAMIDETDAALGGAELHQSDTADHLVEDLEGETNGTRDIGRAIQDASAYSPPDGPVGGGYLSREDH